MNVLTILLVAFEDGSAHLVFTIMIFPLNDAHGHIARLRLTLSTYRNSAST